MIYTLTLNPAIDYFLGFEKKIGLHQKTNNSKLLAGGKGINASIMLRNLNVENKTIVVSGGLIGDKLNELLKKEKLEVIHIDTGVDTRINVKVSAEGDTNELNVEGSKINGKLVNEKLFELASKQFKENDILMIMGSLPQGYSFAMLEALVKHVAKLKVKLVFDLSKDHLFKLVKYKPEVIKPNKKELSELFGVEIKSKEDALTYAAKLLEMGAKSVIVSFDKSGSIYKDATSEAEIKGVKIQEVNGSGAGDSMIAAFVAGIVKNKNNIDKLKLASAAGTATAASEGIGSRKLVLSFVEKIDVKEKRCQK